jgi:histidinol-phosphate aminotransferase
MPISRRTVLRRLGAFGVPAGLAIAAHDSRAATAGGVPELRGSGVPALRSSPGPIRLNRNESVYGPSAAALAAIRDTVSSAVSRYPDIEADALRRTIAAAHRVAPEQVVLGCGSSEILRTAIEVFAGPLALSERGEPRRVEGHNKLVVALPVFESIPGWAERAGVQVVGVPVDREYAHDASAMLARVDADTSLVYICNPHNPTGRITRRADLEAFLRKLPARVVVLIDEAYHHYVGESSEYASFIDKPFDSSGQRVGQGTPAFDSRVIVTRSFSKIYGLAGLRVGYAVTSAQTASTLASQHLSDSVSAVAARAAVAALEDAEHLRVSIRRNIDDRQEFLNEATARMLRPDSVTNFVTLDTGRGAADVVEHFRKHGILVSGGIRGFDQHIRVSLGTPAEMREFWRVWDLVIAHKM